MSGDKNREVCWRINCENVKESGGSTSTLSLSVASAAYVLDGDLCMPASEMDLEVNRTCEEGQDNRLLLFGVTPL